MAENHITTSGRSKAAAALIAAAVALSVGGSLAGTVSSAEADNARAPYTDDVSSEPN